jgi:hypothetical protein
MCFLDSTKNRFSGALIVMHDIGWAEGVQRVVMEDIAPIAKCEGRLPNLYWARI